MTEQEHKTGFYIDPKAVWGRVPPTTGPRPVTEPAAPDITATEVLERAQRKYAEFPRPKILE